MNRTRGTWRMMMAELVVTIQLQPSSPLLVQAPEERDDNEVVPVTCKVNGQEVYYLPGGSMKGALRAHTEKVFYHLFPKKQKQAAKENGCSYEKLDYVSQLFGHVQFRGRLTVDDAYFQNPTDEKRCHVAIDRFRGGSETGALFVTKPLVSGTALTTIRLKNPELWQIAWLCLLLRDWQAGDITIGAKAASGYGRLEVLVSSLDLHMYSKELEEQWKGLGVFEHATLSGDLYSIYHFSDVQSLAVRVMPMWQRLLNGGEAS
ncbi:RAMP superfamily CRISPR-associated protein [Geobacillus sp. C56-T2]|uniref:RAMP superfamily CRISPR-associated protein n=1 Tax=Geobacillus sp. C56-T2 TaxID=600773 RepID=UPI0011AB142D|nr:RAMP superfamily CRISPR-associated protein [Geobacillus sp. C56-T2]NNV06830.1 hypothetical protein [Geobacillus sp. MMMUD3]TWG30822.1 CRISPR/Cas system CSM-associated protein Csm3 (group 7 of RAMP superfamily) [Geobacillus sp. C56-T2]